mgnify:CR=1 FL=1
MGGLFSKSDDAKGKRINESDTQARRVVAAFFVPGKDGPADAVAGAHCRSMALRVAGEDVTVRKPQWALARPYFALDNVRPDYGVLDAWYTMVSYDDPPPKAPGRDVMFGPAFSRWRGATEIEGASRSTFLHSMSKDFPRNAVTLTPTGERLAGSAPPQAADDMLWPTDEAVYPVSARAVEDAVVWNGDYADAKTLLDAGGKRVLQHGSVLLEKVADASKARRTDKLRRRGDKEPRKIVSEAVLIPPAPFLRAMQERSGQDRKGRWVVVVGGAHAAGALGRDCSKYFAEVAFQTGLQLAAEWGRLGKHFDGVVTASASGFCDTVTWDEEVSRGFCSKRPVPAPVYHLRDLNEVTVEGMGCDVPYGLGVVLQSSAWKDDWSGSNRDLVLSLLAQDGLVIYGGLPEPDLELAIIRQSLLPRRPPRMGVVVAGAGREKDAARVMGGRVLEVLFGDKATLRIPDDPVFEPLRLHSAHLQTFMQNRARNSGSVASAAQRIDAADFGASFSGTPFSGTPFSELSFNGGAIQGSEIAARMPVVYQADGGAAARKRIALDSAVQFSGFAAPNQEQDGVNATEEKVMKDIETYCRDMIGDVARQLGAPDQRKAPTTLS